MDKKITIFGVIPVVIFFVFVSASIFTALHSKEPTRFEAFGIVTNANSGSGTITITVNRASMNLGNKFGEDVTFHTGNAVGIYTCSMKTEVENCWKQLSVNWQGSKADRGELKAELNHAEMATGLLYQVITTKAPAGWWETKS